MSRPAIALVDDETDITSVYGELLSDHFQVTTFNSPANFLDYIANFSEAPFEAVISDFQMKEMTGLEMLKRAQSLNLFLPSMLLSGHIDKDVLMDAAKIGVIAFLEKPADLQMIVDTVNKLIVEFQVHNTRRQIREIMTQLREAYGMIRLLLEVKTQDLNLGTVLSENKIGKIQGVEDFQTLLDSLEDRLNVLLSREEKLQKQKVTGS